MVAKEVGATFRAMIVEKRGHTLLGDLKNKEGELHHQFMGCRQQDSHEFLMFLFVWLHEDLVGCGMPALSSSWRFSPLHTSEELTRENSVIDLLFQSE